MNGESDQAFQLDLLRCDNNEKVKVKLEGVQFLGSGIDHAVFAIGDGKIMGFKRSKLASEHPEVEEEEKINIIFQQLYEKVMESNFEGLNKYRGKKDRFFLCFSDQKQMESLCECLEKKAKMSDLFDNIPSNEQFKIDRGCRRVYISQNLFSDNRYNIIIQFKPKTVVNDNYSLKMLERASKDMNMPIQKIKNLLKKSTPLEKTRWFKKQKFNKTVNKKAKKNQNPFNIFYLKEATLQEQMPNLLKTKCFKRVPSSLSQEEKHQLNNTVLIELHKCFSLLEEIHSIQSLFQYSISDICKDKQFEKPITQQLIQLTNQCKDKSIKLKEWCEYIENSDCISKPFDQDQWLVYYQLIFLISLTWKDISIVFRGSYEGGKLKDCNFCVIDDNLKEFRKIKENEEKDYKFLLQYLKAKMLNW